MKEIIVKIKYDEKLQYLNESIIKENLCEYPGCGIIDVNEIKPKFPTDDEIKILTRIDADKELNMIDIKFEDLQKRCEQGEFVDISSILIKNYPQKVMEYLSTVQPISNDVKFIMPDLLKDLNDESK